MTNNERFPGNDIHPTALIAEGVMIGKNNYIGPYCVIGFDAEYRGKEREGRVIIGDNNRITAMVSIDSGTEHYTEVANGAYIMKHCHIGHDAVIGFDVTLSPGVKIGGYSWVHNGTNIGMNAVVHQKVHVPERCMIGMGAVVTKKSVMRDGYKYAGNPIRELGENK